MGDTIRGDFPNAVCSDCGVTGCEFSHWGDLVPNGTPGKFCAACWSVRMWDNQQGRQVRPLGQISMLSALELIEDGMPEFLDKKNDKVWNTLDINYYPPHVKRVWAHSGALRFSLHKIYPCKEGEALFHPHPWPSAMRILSGTYEMVVGYGAGDTPPPVAAKLILPAGTTYEMTHPDSWHYVRPLGEPAHTLLVTGTPWKRFSPKGENLKPLSKEDKDEILNFFRDQYPRK